MAVLVDPPKWRWRGRLWGHLVSDVSYDELHAFASRLGIPDRAFDRDHYDLPEEHLDRAVAEGAHLVTSRELVARMTAAGLRRPRRRGGDDGGTNVPEGSVAAGPPADPKAVP